MQHFDSRLHSAKEICLHKVDYLVATTADPDGLQVQYDFFGMQGWHNLKLIVAPSKAALFAAVSGSVYDYPCADFRICRTQILFHAPGLNRCRLTLWFVRGTGLISLRHQFPFNWFRHFLFAAPSDGLLHGLMNVVGLLLKMTQKLF